MDRDDRKLLEEITVNWTNSQSVVFAFILSVVPNFQDANDILQQVAVSVVKNYEKYNEKYPFVSWAIGIAKNEILMYRRKNSTNKLVFDNDTIECIAESHSKESKHYNDMKNAICESCSVLADHYNRF